jgi:peptidoglycan hydrolase-like protein with peptidoglycan-binding domain
MAEDLTSRTRAIGRALVAFAVTATLVLGTGTGAALAATTVYRYDAPGAPYVSLIGDSTLAGVRWNNTWGSIGSYNFLYDAESCRRTVGNSCRGREGYVPDNVIATMARLDGRLGSVLVIMGGYDDAGATFSGAVDAVMAAAAGQNVQRVMWLTMRTADVTYVGPTYRSGSSTYTDNNKILLAKQTEYPQLLVVADWATYSAPHPEWVYADGIHLRPAGSGAAMDFVKASLDALFATGNLAPIPPPPPPPARYVGLGPGAKGPDVGLVQRALLVADVPAPVGRINVYGAVTAGAVASFQASRDIPASGLVDDATVVALGLNGGPIQPANHWIAVRRGNSGRPVANVQAALANNRFPVRGANGYFGRRTQIAVIRFQTASGLPITGLVDEQTALRLGRLFTAPAAG